MIGGILLLITSPVVYWLASPVDWSYADAVEKLKNGHREQATKKLQEIVDVRPYHTMALFRLGELAFQEGKFEDSLKYAQQALLVAAPEQNPGIIDLEVNCLIALGKKRAAVKAVRKLVRFTSVPKNYSELDDSSLLTLMAQSENRQFFNRLAYTMATARIRIQEAEKYINLVIKYYTDIRPQARLSVPYLFERSSNYELAYAAWFQTVLELGATDIDPQSNSLSESIVSPTESNGEFISWYRSPAAKTALLEALESLKKKRNQKDLVIAVNRLSVLATNLQLPTAPVLEQAIDRWCSGTGLQNVPQIKLADAEFLQNVFDLQHYFDTRAMVRLVLGDEWSAKSIRSGEKDISMFLIASNKASDYYRQGYADLMKSIDSRVAMKKYLDAFPNNSLMITLPSDVDEFDRRRIRNRAIENYHRYLLLIALGREEEAKGYLDKVGELGFEPGPNLF